MTTLPSPLQMMTIRHALENCASTKFSAVILHGEVALCDQHPSAEFGFLDPTIPGCRFIVSILAVPEVTQ